MPQLSCIFSLILFDLFCYYLPSKAPFTQFACNTEKQFIDHLFSMHCIFNQTLTRFSSTGMSLNRTWPLLNWNGMKVWIYENKFEYMNESFWILKISLIYWMKFEYIENKFNQTWHLLNWTGMKVWIYWNKVWIYWMKVWIYWMKVLNTIECKFEYLNESLNILNINFEYIEYKFEYMEWKVSFSVFIMFHLPW